MNLLKTPVNWLMSPKLKLFKESLSPKLDTDPRKRAWRWSHQNSKAMRSKNTGKAKTMILDIGFKQLNEQLGREFVPGFGLKVTRICPAHQS